MTLPPLFPEFLRRPNPFGLSHRVPLTYPSVRCVNTLSAGAFQSVPAETDASRSEKRSSAAQSFAVIAASNREGPIVLLVTPSGR